MKRVVKGNLRVQTLKTLFKSQALHHVKLDESLWAAMNSYCNDIGQKLVKGKKYTVNPLLPKVFWKSKTFPSSDNTGKKWCYTTGWNSGCGDLAKSQRWLMLWNIGSRLFIMVLIRQLCYFGQKRPLSCFLSLNFSQVLKQSLELWGLQRRRVGPK